MNMSYARELFLAKSMSARLFQIAAATNADDVA